MRGTGKTYASAFGLRDAMDNFRFRVSNKRVDYIIKQMNFYGYSGDRVKGLIFCSIRKEAETLSGIFNDREYKTKVLTDADIQDTIKYEDHFTSRSSLIAISKQSRTVESEDVQNFLHAKERGIDVELFVRKNKDDKISKEFYYLGRMTATGYTRPFIMPNTDKTAVEIEWKLDTPVREDIYQYIVNG